MCFDVEIVAVSNSEFRGVFLGESRFIGFMTRRRMLLKLDGDGVGSREDIGRELEWRNR